MSTTDTILAALTEQVRQLQSAIDWLDDHRAIVDQCQTATTTPFHAYVYIHGGRKPTALAKALGEEWERDTGGPAEIVCWWLTKPSFPVMKLCLWDAELCEKPQRKQVEL